MRDPIAGEDQHEIYSYIVQDAASDHRQCPGVW